MIPTLTTSMEKTAAAMGVPNRAEKAALIPHIIMTRLSFSSIRKTFPRKFPMLPPSCRAAPSRPAEPPNRWVRIVAVKIRGAVLRGISRSA